MIQFMAKTQDMVPRTTIRGRSRDCSEKLLRPCALLFFVLIWLLWSLQPPRKTQRLLLSQEAIARFAAAVLGSIESLLFRRSTCICVSALLCFRIPIRHLEKSDMPASCQSINPDNRSDHNCKERYF